MPPTPIQMLSIHWKERDVEMSRFRILRDYVKGKPAKISVSLHYKHYFQRFPCHKKLYYGKVTRFLVLVAPESACPQIIGVNRFEMRKNPVLYEKEPSTRPSSLNRSGPHSANRRQNLITEPLFHIDIE